MELKASSRANNRKLKDLEAKVTKLTEENLSLRNTLDQSRLRINILYEEKDDLWDSLESLEMYSRKNSLEIHGVPREPCPTIEEVVFKKQMLLMLTSIHAPLKFRIELKEKNVML